MRPSIFRAFSSRAHLSKMLAGIENDPLNCQRMRASFDPEISWKILAKWSKIFAGCLSKRSFRSDWRLCSKRPIYFGNDDFFDVINFFVVHLVCTEALKRVVLIFEQCDVGVSQSPMISRHADAMNTKSLKCEFQYEDIVKARGMWSWHECRIKSKILRFIYIDSKYNYTCIYMTC